METKIARTDAEIEACYPVLHELRPHLREETFLERIRAQERNGYRFSFLSANGTPLAVAGFRFGENLAWGRFLYVDDLVTTASARSKGHGAALLRWLHALARAEGCQQLHLDSGTHRSDAHRFYQREGMRLSAYHFQSALE